MALNVLGDDGSLNFTMGLNITDFERNQQKVIDDIKRITKETEYQSSAMETLAKKATTALAAYASFNAAKGFISDIVKVRGEFQQLEVAFTTMLGSKEKSDKLMAEAVKLAATTPFTLQDVGTGTKQLISFGTKAEDVTKTLKMLGNIASGVGAPLNDIVYLYGTLQTQGRAYTRDVMQFAQRGIPIYEELAKVLGTSKDQVGGLVEAGKVGFPEVQKALQNLTTQGGMFFNLMENQSKTLTGQLSNLQDAWSRMLNDIGKSNEGALSGSINIVTELINHYQDVLDILTVLLATYGSYKAAIIATTAVQAIQLEVTKGYTIAETLRFRAMLLSEGAMKLLNKTMLANPAVGVAAAIGGLITYMVLFREKTIEVKTAQDLLADAQKNVGDRFAETEAKIRPYVEALKNANLSEQERLTIYNQLKEIDPKIVEGLTAKTIGYDNLNKRVQDYLKSLREQLRLEANQASVKASIKQEQAIQDRIDAKQKEYDKLQERVNKSRSSYNPYGGSTGSVAAALQIQQLQAQINNLKELKKQQEAVTASFGKQVVTATTPKAQGTALSNKQIIDSKTSLEDLAAFRKQLEDNYNQEQDANRRKQLAEDLKYADARKKTLDVYGASKESAKQLQKEEGKVNTLLEQRKSILEDIQALQRDAKQSGLPKEQSEIDRISEKYDTALQKIKDFNDKVAEFNKKNKTNVQGVGTVDIQAVNQAKQIELSNAASKIDAENYIKNLDKQKELFTQYEEVKKQIGIEKSREMFEAQTKGFTSYLDLLKSEANKLSVKISLGVPEVGDFEKLAALIKQIQTESDNQDQQNRQKQADDYKNLLTAAQTYNQQKAAINKKYDDLEATLEKNRTVADFEQRKQLLKQGRDEELNELSNSLIRQSELYKKLNLDILGFSRDRIKKEITALKDQFKSGIFTDASGQQQDITPELKKKLEEAIKMLQDFYNETDEVLGASVEKLKEAAAYAGQLVGIFNTLADTFRPINSGLADMLSQLSNATNIAGNVLSGLAQVETNPLGAVQSFANAAAGIIGIFTEAKRTAQEAKKAVEEFYLAVQAGEIQTAINTREAMALEAERNKNRLDGLKAEEEQLSKNKKASEDEFNRLLQQVQQEQYIADEKTKKGKGSPLFGLVGVFAGIGAKTKVQQELQSLAGMTYDQIEKLFNEGRLTDKAKDLFIQLQKLKQEGVDIDRQLADIQDQVNQIFTGTTSSSIADAILEGLKQGKRSVADFGDFFQETMQNAALSAFESKVITDKIQQFYDDFAAAAASDNQLTSSEIDNLRNKFNTQMADIVKEFDQLQQVTGLNFSNSLSSSGVNSLQGALKAMTEQTGELLAAQMGGMRISLVEQMKISTAQLNELNRIQANTALTAEKCVQLFEYFKSKEHTGLNVNVR